VRHLYLAATGQNRGKTTAALGFLDGVLRKGMTTGFMKPVGQRTVIQDGVAADEDAVLMKAVFGLAEPLTAMSPVHIPRGFTKSYIAGDVVEDLAARIRERHAMFANRDILLVEGTGHAGVGAVVGLSNAIVAAMLGTPTIIISEGGVGRPIDEIVLNASLFRAHGVEVAGAIVNKVQLEGQPGIEKTLERGLALQGIPLLGILPYRPILSNPTLGMILEGVRGETIHAGPDLDAVIGSVAIGAMEPVHMLERVGPRTLVIVPGDREDVILTIATAHLVGDADGGSRAEVADLSDAAAEVGGRAIGMASPAGLVDVADRGRRNHAAQPRDHHGAALGIVLTGGYRPRPTVIDAIRRADLFATLVGEDTYAVASEVHDLLVKTHAADHEKIELIKELVWEHLDINRILSVAGRA
jgi:BioD-like phosphotransacetylase family protein